MASVNNPGHLLAFADNQLRYYAKVLSRDPTLAFKTIDIPVLHQFLEWSLNQRVGKEGRKIRGTKKGSSINILWKNLQIVYKVATGKKFDQRIYDGITEVYRPIK